MYGLWLNRQRRRVEENHADVQIEGFFAHPLAQRQTVPMKRAKIHSGAYSCPECLIEFELFAEESLKCERCHGPLVKGGLDDAFGGNSEDGDDDPAD